MAGRFISRRLLRSLSHMLTSYMFVSHRNGCVSIGRRSGPDWLHSISHRNGCVNLGHRSGTDRSHIICHRNGRFAEELPSQRDRKGTHAIELSVATDQSICTAMRHAKDVNNVLVDNRSCLVTARQPRLPNSCLQELLPRRRPEAVREWARPAAARTTNTGASWGPRPSCRGLLHYARQAP